MFNNRHHKYIAKIPRGKGYRYFYDTDEYNSYRQGGVGTRSAATGMMSVNTIGNLFGSIHSSNETPAGHPNRPHSRKPKIARGSVTVRKRKKVDDYGLTISPNGVHYNPHRPKPVGGSLNPSMSSYAKRTEKERVARKKARERAEEEAYRKQLHDEEQARKAAEKKAKKQTQTWNHLQKESQVLLNRYEKLRRKRKKPHGMRPGGGGGRIDY